MDLLRDKAPAFPAIPDMPDITPFLRRTDDGYTSADIFKQLVKQVQEFEQKLSEQQEVGILLASFGQAVALQVRRIGYVDPALIIFEGTLDSGTEGRLVQHSNQLSFLLTKLPRAHPEQPRRAIGFGNWQ